MSFSLDRRLFLKGLAAAATLPGQTAAGKTWVYVGCYTARGQGIYVYEMNPSNGSLAPVRIVGSPATIPNPSFLALSPNGKYLYCGNEIGNFGGAQSGSVTGFATDYATGNLNMLNSQPTQGRNPAHVSVDATGRFVIAANYSGTTTATNHVALLPIGDDGRLEAASSVITHTGQLGTNTARQEAPHAHMAMPDPTGRFILVNDLGLDRTFVYRLDRAERQLVATSAPGVAVPGDGPRHLAFHPNGRFLYVLNELSNTVAVWTWDAETGAMSRFQTISTLPNWYRGVNTTAQILVSPDGRFVYASNRGHDSIAVFSCDAQTGRLTAASRHWTFGETPRNFNIDPSGRYMYVGHQNTDNLVVFQIDRATGALAFTGHTFLSPGQPVCIIFHSEPLAGNSATGNVTFAATQNPVLAGSNGAAQVTLGWNAPGASEVELRIGAPDGVNMGRNASWGTATTGQWVTDGMTFYLQDVTGGKPLTAANTLGTVRVHHRK